MFVFFMIVVGLVCWTISAIITNRDERRHRNRAIQNGYDSYTDRNGILRRVDTNEPYWLWRDLRGEVWEINPYTRKVLKNVSGEARFKKWQYEREISIREGRKTFQAEGLYDYERGRGRQFHSAFDMKGCHYINVDDGTLYVKREAFGKPWYLGVESKRIEFCDTAEMGIYYKSVVASQYTTERNANIEKWNREYIGYGFQYFLPGDTIFNYVDIQKEANTIANSGYCIWKTKQNCHINIMEVTHKSFSYVINEASGVPEYKTIDGYFVVADEIVDDWIETERSLLNDQIQCYISNIQNGHVGDDALYSYDVYLNKYYYSDATRKTDRKFIIGPTSTDNFRQNYINNH